MKRELKVIPGGAETAFETEEDYKQQISQHFEFIEKQCYKALRLRQGDFASEGEALNLENEALELSNQVLDILRRDDYRVLREFKGQSRFTTYLTAIISRRAVDMIRKKRGRGREKERAKEWGDTGLLVYQRVIKENIPPQQVYNELKAANRFNGTLEELETMVTRIRGSNPAMPANGTVVRNGIVLDDDRYIVPDTGGNPRQILEESQRRRQMQEVLSKIVSQLNGEERILLRMRFPTREGRKPVPVEQVAQVLGIAPKAVYKRVARLIKKCKQQLEQQGVDIHDIL